MSEPSTKPTSQNPKDFLNTIEPEQKRKDSFELLEIFEKATGEKPVMWGSSIIGFGKYHYKSEKSSQEGDWLLVGFSPRKQNLTLYIRHGNEDKKELIEKLGKVKEGGGCLYINKLSDIDQKTLEKIIKNSFQSKRMYSS